FTASLPSRLHTLSLHDALPILFVSLRAVNAGAVLAATVVTLLVEQSWVNDTEVILQDIIKAEFVWVVGDFDGFCMAGITINHILDRKSTRLNSSHVKISYAVFC